MRMPDGSYVNLTLVFVVGLMNIIYYRLHNKKVILFNNHYVFTNLFVNQKSLSDYTNQSYVGVYM